MFTGSEVARSSWMGTDCSLSLSVLCKLRFTIEVVRS